MLTPQQSNPESHQESEVNPEDSSQYHFSVNNNSKKKERVSSACSNCRRNHTCCDENRPCSRCIKLGKQDTCVDVVSKKRGPKPKTKSIKNSENKQPVKKQKLDNSKISPKVQASTMAVVKPTAILPNLQIESSIPEIEVPVKKDEDFEIEDPLKLDLDIFDEEFSTIVKQAYDEIIDTPSSSSNNSSYLLNYDGFQYDVGINSSLSLLSSENQKDSKNTVGYIQCNSNIQICEVNDIVMEKFGYKNEIFSMHWFDLIHPSYRNHTKQFIENIIQKKDFFQNFSGREIGYSKDGSAFEFMYQMSFQVKKDLKQNVVLDSIITNIYF
eukprot:gene2446-3156_t